MKKIITVIEVMSVVGMIFTEGVPLWLFGAMGVLAATLEVVIAASGIGK